MKIKDAFEQAPEVADQQENENATYDCAFLEPLAFPPDLPPVIFERFVWVDWEGCGIEFGLQVM